MAKRLQGLDDGREGSGTISLEVNPKVEGLTTVGIKDSISGRRSDKFGDWVLGLQLPEDWLHIQSIKCASISQSTDLVTDLGSVNTGLLTCATSVLLQRNECRGTYVQRAIDEPNISLDADSTNRKCCNML